MEEENKLIEERREKLKALRAAGAAYPNDFRRKDLASQLVESHGARTREDLEKTPVNAVGHLPGIAGGGSLRSGGEIRSPGER